MSIVTRMADGLQNVISGLGTTRDKSANSFYGRTIYTDEQLRNAFDQSWLARKIITIPAMDACRNWRNWQAESDAIEAIEEEERKHSIKEKTLEAKTLARLWGGAALYIGVDGDQSEPLDLERVGQEGLKYVRVLTKHDLAEDIIEDDIESENFGKPKFYSLTINSNVKIHPSRLAIFEGVAKANYGASSPAENSWGNSALENVMQACQDTDATVRNVAGLIFEAKIDVIHVKDLMGNLANQEYEDRLTKRFSLATLGKGNNGTLMLDTEETYEQKSGNFANLSDLIMTFLQIVSGAADIPATRFLGQSPSGMNSTGDADIRNYYDRIAAMQELELEPPLFNLDECIIRSALGNRPPEVHYEWASLWQISEKEKADIGKLHSETAKNWVDTGLIPQEVLAKVIENQAVESGTYAGMETAMGEFLADNPNYFEELEETKRAQEEAALKAITDPQDDEEPEGKKKTKKVDDKV